MPLVLAMMTHPLKHGQTFASLIIHTDMSVYTDDPDTYLCLVCHLTLFTWLSNTEEVNRN